MPAESRYVTIDLKNVKSSPDRIVPFLNNYIKNFVPGGGVDLLVIFLGEDHGSEVDREVTKRILANPPLPVGPRSYVFYERLLEGVYAAHANFGGKILKEGVQLELRRYQRSEKIAEKINNVADDMDCIYIVCGSAHATEIYDRLVSIFQGRFVYLTKLSDQEY